jgi:uncharacterized transporter YbjL
MADPIKDECPACAWVLAAAGLAVAGVLAFMAIDLATDGRLSGAVSRTAGLATVTELIRPDGDASDAG